MKIKSTIFLLLLYVGFLPVAAHPGHGTFDDINLMHYFTSPLHVIMFAVVIGLMLYISALRKAQNR